MLPQLNSIVFDVVVIVALLTFIALGVFKGFKHTTINSLLLVGSIMISFTSLTNVIKEPIATLLAKMVKVNENIGLSVESKMAISLAFNLMAAVILTLLVYLVLRLIKFIIYLAVRHHRKLNRANAPRMTTLSRVFGGLISFVVNGVLLVVFLSIFDNPAVGLNKTIDNTYVSKYVVRVTDKVIEATGKDVDTVKNGLLLKTIKTDVFYKASDEEVLDLKTIGETMTKEVSSIKKVTKDNAQDYVNAISSLLDLQKRAFYTKNGENYESIKAFEEFNNICKEQMTKHIIELSNAHGSEPKMSGIENTNSVYESLKVLYGEELAEKFALIFMIA